MTSIAEDRGGSGFQCEEADNATRKRPLVSMVTVQCETKIQSKDTVDKNILQREMVSVAWQNIYIT